MVEVVIICFVNTDMTIEVKIVYEFGLIQKGLISIFCSIYAFQVRAIKID